MTTLQPLVTPVSDTAEMEYTPEPSDDHKLPEEVSPAICVKHHRDKFDNKSDGLQYCIVVPGFDSTVTLSDTMKEE